MNSKRILNEYEQQAADFLTATGAKMTIRRAGVVDRFPNCDDFPTGDRYRYRVTIQRGAASYSFYFYDSINNYRMEKRPRPYDILATVEKCEPAADVFDFAAEYGYTIDSRDSFRKVERIRRACEKQYNKLLDLFGAELMEQLAEIA